MKRITDEELLELGLGSKIRIIWHNSPYHNKNEECHGVVFGKKIGWEDNSIDDKETIIKCMHNDWCMVYLLTE